MASGWSAFLGRHVKILRQGVGVWNEWRKEHPDVDPLLKNVVLPALDKRERSVESDAAQPRSSWK